jgi:HlyD family secretion protein
MKNLGKAITALMVIGIIGAILTVAGCGKSSGSSSKTQTQTYTVQKGTLLSTVSAVGDISMPEQVKLTFGSGGSTNDLNTVQEVDVNFGDTVKKGDVLAKIDTASLERAVEQAKANLRTAQINLEQASSETNILKAQASVESAKASLASAEKDLSDAQTPYSAADIAKAQATVQSATANLAVAEQDLQETQTSIISDADAAVRDAQVALDNAQRSLDTAQKNGDVSITDAENSLSDAEKAYNNFVQSNIGILDRWNIAEQKASLAWNVQKAQANLDIAKSQAASSIATAENNLAKAKDALQSAEENLVATKAGPPQAQQKQSAVATAKAALDKANEDLAAMQPDPTAIQQKQSAVATAKANLAQAQDNLAYVEAGYDTELLQIKVDNAQVALDDANEQLQAATIVAPFDGVVAAVNAKVGDKVTSTEEIIYLVNTSKVEVASAVDETDVAKVKAGQTAVITLDAISDARLRGTVGAVSPIGQKSSGVVTYTFSIEVQDTQGYDLKEGMTAAAEIVVLNKTDVILVPSSAITQSGRNSVVEVVTANGTTEQRTIQTGATNGTQTEVVSGLSEGEKILVKTSTTSSTTTSGGSSGRREEFFIGPGGGPGGPSFEVGP